MHDVCNSKREQEFSIKSATGTIIKRTSYLSDYWASDGLEDIGFHQIVFLLVKRDFDAEQRKRKINEPIRNSNSKTGVGR